MQIDHDPEEPPTPVRTGDDWGIIVIRLILGGGILILGLGILAFQCYLYLQNGVWTPISIIDAGLWIESDWAWGGYPTEWIGVYRILGFIPTSAAVMVVGYIILVVE